MLQNKVSWRGWMEMLQISLYFYCHSDIHVLPMYKKSLSSLELCFCALAMQIHQNQAFYNHQSMTKFCFRRENGRSRTFTVIAAKEWNRQGYIKFLYLSPTFLTSYQRSLEKEKQQRRGISPYF